MTETISTQSGAGKPVVIQKSLSGLDGWLSFAVVAFGASAIGFLWAFFISIASLTTGGAEGVALGLVIETLIFSLGLVVLCGLTLFLLVNKKKLSVVWAYITLGVQALYATVMSITSMFQSYSNCTKSYYTYSSRCVSEGLPVSAIIMLIGAIFATWASTLLVAYYFKKSARVKATLVQ
jgi:hypothetical protein